MTVKWGNVPFHRVGTVIQRNFDRGPREPCDGRISEGLLKRLFDPRLCVRVYRAQFNV